MVPAAPSLQPEEQIGTTEPLTKALRSFVASMTRGYDLSEMCLQLCEHSVEVLGAHGAGVSVADEEGALRYVTATDASATHVERVQERFQDGPCKTAYKTQEVVVVQDIEEETAWPQYRVAAMEVGYSSVLGIPLRSGEHALGALNVYHLGTRAWDEGDLDMASVLADMATAYLSRASELEQAHKLTAQLQAALDSRVVIEQAKGMIASELQIDVDDAFELLRDHARSNGARLSDLAQDVIERKLTAAELSNRVSIAD